FWQEYKRVVRSLAISCVVVLAVLALGREIETYSRFVLLSSFALLFIFLPVEKYFLKRWLYRFKIWGREALVLGDDPFFEREVFGNPYLGYIRAQNRPAKTLFVASNHQSAEDIESILDTTVKHKQEVIFIPLIKSYDFSDSHIIHLFNARTNLIVLENKLLSRINQLLKGFFDYLLSLLLLPFALMAMGVIAWLIKRQEPHSPIFFCQSRMGKDGNPYICYKFRSMSGDADLLLEYYLNSHPEEIRNYEIYHKYENDPRITSIGRFLRKTSLDELPQILNVIRGDMSLIGPRPYMFEEEEKMGEKTTMILAVKPGITGLWQVSGRSELEFKSRVELDVWYVRNWSLWTDFVILVKTVKVVLQREGAM
ncbi:MAG: exopolysaccharide biosynthesis polyprenyl glycosylphosphotransferase, partial [Sulfuricurvum sp.]|uniref:exopolysaccharide biosynthesis polyprenyl glycosylphosphotransferase n=1 Tax=Sulfuricurvum sp. TaxID=2025608 RepID=UPI0025E46DBD